MQILVVCLKDMFRVQEAPITTTAMKASLSLSLSLCALGFDACLHKDKLKWSEAYNKSSSTGAQYVALQIGWRKFKICQLGSAKSFWTKMLRLVKDTAKSNTCCWLARSFDWSRWVAISSLPTICSPSFSSMGGVGKK